ncbi:hypothetical protein [Spiroplasma endosymbiont of Colias croceus]|uniref:hypothetical protein n=1 Tax=Spiroplasma endosymbiont of Colias croceus TaxID=3066310 RepID=UPI0030D05998
MLTNLINAVTPSGALDSIWHGLGSAMVKIKEGIYSILPEIMLFLGDFWIILIPFAAFFIIKILNTFRHLIKGF